MPDHELSAFTKGVHNLLNDEIIPADAAQDEKNWYTQDGKLKLIPGRLRIGVEGPVGAVQGQIFGYKVDGTKIHWRKIGTTIQYFDGTTWQTTVSGLTASADYFFSNYSSLAGTFTFAFGVDGIFKMHNANPGSYSALYDSAINFKGFAFIDRGRTILWNRPEDKTGLYGSRIDRQDSTTYQSVIAELIGSGNGSNKNFSGTLAFRASPQSNAFGVQIFAQIGATATITAIGKAGNAPITTSGAHGLTLGQFVLFQAVVGMTQMNNLIGKVTSTPDSTHFTVNIDSTLFTTYVSGGTVGQVETFKDNYLGVLTGDQGSAGTINYTTGAWAITMLIAPPTNSTNVQAAYQWENSNSKGVTDFTKSPTRLAGEGFIQPQDEGGDAILRVLIGQDGAYYSIKSQSTYQFTMDDTDTEPTNLVYRRNMGVPSLRAATSMQKGIVFINTANPEKPEVTILQRNPVGGDIEPAVLFPQFKFANYLFDDCNIDTFERYVIIMCKTLSVIENDTILLCDLADGTVDITAFNARTSATDSGSLHIGSSITQTVYELYSGFDDDGLPIDNYWISKGENLRPAIGPKGGMPRRSAPPGLKKVRYLRLKGHIDPNQRYEVYVSYDDAGFQLVGTVRGDGSYVDSSTPQEVGVSMVGASQVGGDVTTIVFPYFIQLKLKAPKFRKRTLKFVAKNIGYVDIENTCDHDIIVFENRIPKRFRLKQNVSLDGLSTDQSNPSY